MAPSLIVMVREAVVVSATYGGLLYLLIHCTLGESPYCCLDGAICTDLYKIR